MKELLFFVLICALASPSEEAILSSVPPLLLDCYRRGGPDLAAPHRLDVFLSLLRRLELSSRLDMRLFSTTLLRSLRLDGIEESPNTIESDYVLPFRASAFQFHKYKLLMEVFLPSQPDILNVDESLTLIEKCLLHKMLSSTVQPWERGDENEVCPLSAQRRQTMTRQSANRINSRCPIEDGVIKTEWGTISPGTLVAALASALEPQQVTISDILKADIFKEEISQAMVDSAMEDWYTEHEEFDIDDQSSDTNNNISNLWVATLAGDLAEVVVNQGPLVGASEHRMLVGSSNRWNDTLLPRDYYLFPPNGTLPNWHFTDAEILAGIDGLILANYLPTWVGQRRSLGLSQVLDMYYSNEGVSFNTTVRACNRHALYASIVNGSQLIRETSRFAHMLSLQQITVYIPRKEMERMSEAAATAFMNYVPTILRNNHQECRITFSDVPSIDLIVATDGSWTGYEIEQFMSWIGNALEVEAHSSTIALLHGNNGRWIVSPTSNLTSFYSTISNSTIEWPNRLNLPNVISRIIQHSRNSTLEEIAAMASAGHSTVVLIISPTDRPSSEELEQSRVLMQSLRRSFFDIYFAYVALDTTDFQNVNNEYLDYSELFITVNSNALADVIDAIYTNLVKTDIPSRIFGSQCEVNGTEFMQVQYEDHVLPGRKQTYRIHPFYLKQQPIIHVQFRNDGQGQILVCMWRGADVSRICQTIVERETYIVNITDPCPSPGFCPPAHFIATTITTSNLCAHDQCRLPHQVGYYIQHSGLRCLPLLGSAASVSPFWKAHIALSLMVSLMYLTY
ncbi:uncharacterized protein LOC120630414 [Pararge aegeria]|uniref:Jg11484 protein n=1 Tax=Pararge aegeria aegeria TaxID=348720 RepID=A0A8S4RNF7_9NEOP|nr:uncharacterized protein LOC120630414 [Pararge aegeria]CAH2238202.1 jg11484 [Pararge aegeria aegeria]